MPPPTPSGPGSHPRAHPGSPPGPASPSQRLSGSSDAPARPPRPTSPLPLTGERTVPGVPDERYWFQRHVVAYELAATRIRQRSGPPPRVLDAGCGEGYGLVLLADAGAGQVIGVDYDAATAAHASATYAGVDRRVEVHRAELLDLPLADDSIDLTVSFQVIEHVHDVAGYLASLRRVTRPGGDLLIATPNRLTFTPDSDTPLNPFHVREFTAAELTDVLRAADLQVVEVVGVHHGAPLRAAEREHGAGMLRLLADDPQRWPTRLRHLVHRVEPSWFEVRTDDLDASLDLIARCRVPDPATGAGPATGTAPATGPDPADGTDPADGPDRAGEPRA